MRVCIVSRELAPFTGWGVGTYAANAARALADAGHDTHVLTAPAAGLPGAPGDPLAGVRVHTIDRAAPPASLRHVPCRATQGPLAIFQTLRAVHDRHAFDYIEFADVYAEGYFAVQARRTMGLFDRAALAVRLHSPVFLLRRVNGQHAVDHETACVEHMEQAVLREADLVLAPSRAIVDAVSDGPGTPSAHVLPYPFHPALLTPGAAREASGGSGRPEILFAGRLEYRKGVQLLIDAAQQLMAGGADITVRIIGVDTATAPGGRSMIEWLRSLIEPRHADRFLFEPNRARTALAAAVRQATVCCVPSLWENYPFVLLEAMSQGACVVGAAAGGIPEIIRDGVDGLLFAPGDAPALAGRLRAVLDDGHLRARLAAAAPERVAALCNPGAIVARLESLVAERRRAHDEPASLGESSTPSTRSSSAGRPRIPTVSVLIPFYNLARFLPECLDSVRAQTVAPAEVIVIDDGSTEPDARALIERLETDSSVRVIRQSHRGLSAARNAGLRDATGRWVLPLDADDLLLPTFIERALDAAARNPHAVLVTSWMSCFEQDAERPTLLFVPIGFDRDLLCVVNVASSCTALLDRDAVLAAGGYDESLPAFEDWDLYCTLAERAAGPAVFSGARAAVVPEPLIHNRIRPESMLRRMAPSVRRELHAIILAKHPHLPVDAARVIRMLLPKAAAPADSRANGRTAAGRPRSWPARLARRLRGS